MVIWPKGFRFPLYSSCSPRSLQPPLHEKIRLNHKFHHPLSVTPYLLGHSLRYVASNMTLRHGSRGHTVQREAIALLPEVQNNLLEIYKKYQRFSYEKTR